MKSTKTVAEQIGTIEGFTVEFLEYIRENY